VVKKGFDTIHNQVWHT